MARGAKRVERPLPPPLPPAERTVGQLVAETIKLYGRRFMSALPIGLVVAETFDIDEDLAAAIVAYRRQTGPFKTWKDIAAVPGINSARVEEQKDNLDFSVSLGPGQR